MDISFKEIQVEKLKQESFLEFVYSQIQKLEELSQIDPYNITLQELNTYLTMYEKINLSLLGLSALLENELAEAQRDFDLWYAEKFIIQKNKQHRVELSAQKWASQRELDFFTKVENKEEYVQRQVKVSEIERKLNFVNSLIKSWEKQLSILMRLSSNLELEVKLGRITA